jgi:hypothetical protein
MNSYNIFTYITTKPLETLNFIQLLLSLFIAIYSGYKLLIHSVITIKRIFSDFFICIFWCLLCVGCLLYFYTKYETCIFIDMFVLYVTPYFINLINNIYTIIKQ